MMTTTYSSLVLLLLLAAAGQSATSATPARVVLWDAAGRVPPAWARGSRAKPDAPVTFRVALAGANTGVEDALARVSDPLSPAYGHYLTPAELRARFAAPTAVQARAEDFFARHGVACGNLGGAALACQGSAAALEDAFQTEFYQFTHRASGKTVVRHTGTLSLPRPVANAVDFVSGLGQFMHFPGQRIRYGGTTASAAAATAADGTTCGGSHGQDCYVTPYTLRQLYNVSDAVATGSPKTSVGVAEFSGNFDISDDDLKTFGTNIGSAASPLKIDRRGGHPNDPQQQVSEEAQLDIQYTSGLGNGVQNWVWNAEHWMFAFCTDLQNVSSAAARPAVISMSYAWNEAQQCGGVTGAECQEIGVDSEKYVARTNQEFAKVGLLGITMLSASGDSGCHGRTEGICVFQKGMKPDYPASSPYVTSVGGTMLHGGTVATVGDPVCTAGGSLAGQCAAGGTEVVSSTGPAGGRISSGGGFANFSPMPTYQQALVGAYLANDTVMQFAGGRGTLFNAKGRGYPDIAALAHKFYIVMDGHDGEVDGTSAASPTVAGLVGLINTQRQQAGKPAVGFFNPMLYAVHNATGGAAFQDITEGNNACTEQGCWCKTGFMAAPGWDAATGLGTPNVGKMLEGMAMLDRLREEQQRSRE